MLLGRLESSSFHNSIVLKVTLVVGTTAHNEHTDTVAFNPSVLVKCGIFF